MLLSCLEPLANGSTKLSLKTSFYGWMFATGNIHLSDFQGRHCLVFVEPHSTELDCYRLSHNCSGSCHWLSLQLWSTDLFKSRELDLMYFNPFNEAVSENRWLSQPKQSWEQQILGFLQRRIIYIIARWQESRFFLTPSEGLCPPLFLKNTFLFTDILYIKHKMEKTLYLIHLVQTVCLNCWMCKICKVS